MIEILVETSGAPMDFIIDLIGKYGMVSLGDILERWDCPGYSLDNSSYDHIATAKDIVYAGHVTIVRFS